MARTSATLRGCLPRSSPRGMGVLLRKCWTRPRSTLCSRSISTCTSACGLSGSTLSWYARSEPFFSCLSCQVDCPQWLSVLSGSLFFFLSLFAESERRMSVKHGTRQPNLSRTKQSLMIQTDAPVLLRRSSGYGNTSLRILLVLRTGTHCDGDG